MTIEKMFGRFAFHIVTFLSYMASDETFLTIVTNHSRSLTKKKIKQNWEIQS
jgi:hypothetical protein